MKIVKYNKAKKKENSTNCHLLEYGIELNDKDVDCALVHITGRYPKIGYCVNSVCKELVYVLEGFGTLNTKNEVINFEKGDVLLINKGDMYFWDGNCKLILVCTPPWYKEQYKLCEE